MDFDDILTHVGEFGTYQQIMLWFVLLPGVVPCGFQAYNQLFMAAKPDHWCKVPEIQHLLPQQPELFKNLSIPLEYHDRRYQYSTCFMHDHNYTQVAQALENQEYVSDLVQIVPCKHGWNYDKTLYQNTIVKEWDLVCDKDLYTTIALVLFGASGLIGNFIYGYVMDSIGRKPTFFIYLFILCLFGTATAFANNFIVWTIFRIGAGFTVPAILSTPWVLSIELVGPRHRTICTLLTNIAYSLALVMLAIIVWLIKDWRILALATAVPFILLFGHWWVLPESPRWLISQGRFKEAEKVLLRMAKVNGKILPANYISELQYKGSLEKSVDQYRNYGVRDLLRTPNLRWKTIIITFIWFTNTSVYVGLSYYAPALGGDEFLNFFLAGVVELPTYLFLWPSMERWGRRWTLCVSMVIGGTACLTTFLVQNDSVVTLGLYCVGKMGISSSFVVLPLMASELYPTVVRGLGMSTSSVFSMLGPTIIPLINYLGTDMLTLPLMIMGSLLIIGGIVSLLLPETLHKHLPQTLEDGEKVGLDFSLCCPPPIPQMPKIRSNSISEETKM